ncbi:hypothetical protein DEFDS_P231 (plasmid) [Deferribacter desulfuricans SSM1]|uniref:Uncharacterized protein n=1 Tax=Deferribacter desulfuricans (strain DSM 14783 / JCM 11476 / NBRC 101012 / SSM1) TaxID=639282 RepID=D3PF59_DEFDS|nr:hypothetical protein [Deferribacter desulfuricans]BAI81851.1 hypothetical protein DEFDS_P231 [Deferribacter desulfuricans SSM1]
MSKVDSKYVKNINNWFYRVILPNVHPEVKEILTSFSLQKRSEFFLYLINTLHKEYSDVFYDIVASYMNPNYQKTVLLKKEKEPTILTQEVSEEETVNKNLNQESNQINVNNLLDKGELDVDKEDERENEINEEFKTFDTTIDDSQVDVEFINTQKPTSNSNITNIEQSQKTENTQKQTDQHSLKDKSDDTNIMDNIIDKENNDLDLKEINTVIDTDDDDLEFLKKNNTLFKKL